MAIRTEQEALLNSISANSLAAVAPGTTTIIDGDSSQVEVTGPFFAITALSDAVIDSSECTANITSIGATLTIPQGITIYGNFTSIALDEGVVVAYSR